MRRRLTQSLWSLSAMALLLAWSLPTASAQTLGDKLNAAIYQEETAGNLPEAIKIYRQVIDEGNQSATLAARANLRLATCLKKMGKTSEYRAELESVITRYPQATEEVQTARRLLVDEAPLSAAPWKAGECQTLVMKLAGGQPIGIVGLNIDAPTVTDAPAAWRMRIRRYIFGGQNQGATELLVDQATNRPLKTRWQHTLLGEGTATYAADHVTIMRQTPQPSEKTISVSNVIYSNDQLFFTMRQLPLAVGFQTTLPTCVEFGSQVININVTVPKMEEVTTPAGKFNCFRVEMNIGQTFWIADNTRRELVKFDAESITGELQQITSGEAYTVNLDDAKLSLQVPPDWHSLIKHQDDAPTATLVSPQMTAVIMEAKPHEAAQTTDLQTIADERTKTVESRHKKFHLHDGSRQLTRMADHDAIRFVYDFEVGGLLYTAEETLAPLGDRDIVVNCHTRQSDFATERTAVESIINSMKSTGQ